MTGTSEHGTGWSDLDAARLLLEKLGVKPADLMAAPARTEFPLIADYLPLVEQAVTTGTLRVYGPYWAKVVREWGHRHVNEPCTASKLLAWCLTFRFMRSVTPPGSTR